MIPPPSHSRMAQMATTTRQKLRPAFFSDAKPKATPAPAMTMISQLSQPSREECGNSQNQCDQAKDECDDVCHVAKTRHRVLAWQAQSAPRFDARTKPFDQQMRFRLDSVHLKPVHWPQPF
jgi:hypothetical protein